MPINSQFLLFYIDELLRSHWVVWSEKYLSRVPENDFRTRRGFQQVTGSESSSTVRTRALDLYKLTLIKGKLISARTGETSPIPKGWLSICEGQSIHTSLGYISYCLGRALREAGNNNNRVNRALNTLALFFVWTISFKYQQRWYSTATIAHYALQTVEHRLSRKLDNDELRYLSGAVFNTLEGPIAHQLIESYTKNAADFKLQYTFREGKQAFTFNVDEFPDVISEQAININETERHKACLFWSNPDRGIFSKALSSRSCKLIHELTSYDQKLALEGKGHPLTKLYEQIENGEITDDVLVSVVSLSEQSVEISREVKKAMKDLQDGMLESLSLINEQIKTEHSFDRFYVHEDIELPDDDKTIKLKAPIKDTIVRPNENAYLVINEELEYLITHVEEKDGEYIITAAKEDENI